MSTAAYKSENGHIENASEFAADDDKTSLPMRGDTFLGVFEAIGRDLGFNPNWLRIPFAALILWNPLAVVGTYLGLGAVVALSRWLFPVNVAAQSNSGRSGANDEAPGGSGNSEERLAA